MSADPIEGLVFPHRVDPCDAAGEPMPAAVQSQARHISEAEDRIVRELELRLKYGADAVGGEALGFAELDANVFLGPGHLAVVGAREGVGKTAWGLQVARTIATRTSAATGKGGTVLYFITEMSVQQTVERVVASFAQLEIRSLKRGVTLSVVEAVKRAFALLRDSGLWIVDAVGWSVDKLVADARAFRRDHDDLRAVFVDNLTGVHPSQVRRSQGSYEYVGEIVEKLLVLAHEAKGVCAPVILFSHLRRSNGRTEDTPPNAQDFAGSDLINRWADVLVLLHQRGLSGQPSCAKLPPGVGPFDDMFIASDSSKWRRNDIGTPATDATHELLVVKNRTGKAFVCDLRFVGEQMRFEDPNQATTRPYELPRAENAGTAGFRRELLSLGRI